MKQRLPTMGGGYKIYRTNPDATKGAQVGVDLYDPSGGLVQWADILNPPTVQQQGFNGTSDDVSEGQFNLYFTNQRAQDAVGAILTNSSNVTLAYNGVAHSITADLTNVTVTAGGTLRKWAFDSKGRLLASNPATTDDLTEGTSNLYFTKPRVGAALSAGAGITITTDPITGISTISESALTIPNLTDQTGVNLTDQASVILTANGTTAGIPIMASYTLGTLPSAATYTHGMIYVSDLSGSPAPCYSDGTNWRRFSDNTIAS